MLEDIKARHNDFFTEVDTYVNTNPAFAASKTILLADEPADAKTAAANALAFKTAYEAAVTRIWRKVCECASEQCV